MLLRLEGDSIKYAATVITVGRMVGAFLLLLIKPLSVPFFMVYTLCGASDILDGYIARKTNTTSRLGEVLDSIADFVFIAAMMFIFLPLIAWKSWMLYWIGIIALIRFLALGIGFVRYRAISSLHTYANKLTGIVLFCFPFLYRYTGLTVTVIIVCGMASLAALEELIITVYSKKLDRNTIGIFFNRG